MFLRKRIGNPQLKLSLKLNGFPLHPSHSALSYGALKWGVLCLMLFINGIVSAQNVAINSDGSLPDKNAILDIKSGSKGLLIPRMTTDARTRIPNTQGLMVYDINTNSFWYNTGKSWLNMAPGASMHAVADSAWLLTGNTGTVDGVNFLGTLDNVPLSFRVNNQFSGKIDHIKFNTFFGYRAGASINPMPFFGRDNTGYGFEALMTNSSGISNTAVGGRALRANTTGGSNTALGEGTLSSNTTGGSNTATGVGALFANTTGQGNTASGVSALFNNTAGGFNTAYGSGALFENTTSSFNTAVGWAALTRNTTGHDNTATGTLALNNNTTGQANSGFGKEALFFNTTGFRNTALGGYALYRNTTASDNTAVGFEALYFNSTGTRNTANGAWSLFSNTTGTDNTGDGYLSLYANTTGSRNTAGGVRALTSNNTGSNNTAYGAEALRSAVSGSSNTAIGSGALFINVGGDANTATGVSAMFNNNTGSNNTGYGAQSLLNNTSGTGNTGTGFFALSNNTTGTRNTAIGYQANVSVGNLTNATAIGNDAIVNASNKVRIGNAAVTVIEGQVPFTTPSDGRFKFGIQEDVKGLDFIMALRPVTYQFDVRRFDGVANASSIDGNAYDEAAGIRRTGFIAQEVEEAAIRSGYNFSGIIKPKTSKEHYSLSYDAFVVPLVKGMQEQQAIIDAQKKEIDELKERLNRIERLLERSK